MLSTHDDVKLLDAHDVINKQNNEINSKRIIHPFKLCSKINNSTGIGEINNEEAHIIEFNNIN